jgi:hypothetical protein
MSRARVVGARPRQVDHIERGERLVQSDVRLGDDVVRRRYERAWIAGARESVSDSGQRSDVSYRMRPRARRSEGRTYPRPREAEPAPRR